MSFLATKALPTGFSTSSEEEDQITQHRPCMPPWKHLTHPQLDDSLYFSCLPHNTQILSSALLKMLLSLALSMLVYNGMCACACVYVYVCICMQWQWMYSCSHSLHYITVPTGRLVSEVLVRKKDANIKKNSSLSL